MKVRISPRAPASPPTSGQPAMPPAVGDDQRSPLQLESLSVVAHVGTVREEITGSSPVMTGRRGPFSTRLPLIVAFARHRTVPRIVHVCLVMGLVTLAGCEPPTEVINLRGAPQVTRDAMLQVRILPLGMAPPPGAGSVGPVEGFGCGETSSDASSEAVEQLRVKALRMHATAVMDVVVERTGSASCFGGYPATAHGIAVGPRGMPSAY